MNPIELIQKLSADLPHFEDGRINYSSATEAPVVNCAVYAQGNVLLVKRSPDSLAYPEKWNGISGFMDRIEAPEVTARRELLQETKYVDFERFVLGEPYTIDDPNSKVWHVFPFRVELDRMIEPQLNEEHTAFQWVDPAEVTQHDILPDFEKVIRVTIKL